MRGLHAFCVSFTRQRFGFLRELGAKALGMDLVKDCGLIMKPRGMMLDSPPCFTLPRCHRPFGDAPRFPAGAPASLSIRAPAEHKAGQLWRSIKQGVVEMLVLAKNNYEKVIMKI